MIEAEIREDLDASLEDALRAALRSVDVARTMARVEATIKRRVAKGEFLEGSSPGAESYSTNELGVPAGSVPQKVRDKAEEDDTVSSYTTPDEDLWMLFEGGYKQLREMKGLQVQRVDLFDTGQMLGGMRTRSSRGTDGDLSMEVGYIKGMSPAEAIELANYHDRLGAGASQVIRRFVGLSEDEADTILDGLEEEIEAGLPED